MKRGWGFIAAIVLLLAAGGYLFYENSQLKDELDTQYKEVSKLSADLATQVEENSKLEDEVLAGNQRLRDLEKEVMKITGSVSEIEKLSKLDPELLQKYSKVSFLSENYIPDNLTLLDKKYSTDPSHERYLEGRIIPYLTDLLEDAENSNVSIRIASAYRSFEDQALVKGQNVITYGSGANKFSADQGYSEHQLGTTVDFSELGKTPFLNFDKTSSYEWLTNNAYRYGFILSYPPGNSYYVSEPWHWRFVGRKLANYLHQEHKNFYDLSQREIDQYLITIFD